MGHRKEEGYSGFGKVRNHAEGAWDKKREEKNLGRVK